MSEITIDLRFDQRITIHSEDVMNFTIDVLRNPRQHQFGSYGYDIYVNHLTIFFFHEKYDIDHQSSYNQRTAISPLFIDVCWELCRRGIIRPFTQDIKGQGTTQGAGFSITSFGKQWLAENNSDTFVPTEPDRFAQMLKPYATIFGDGFHERAQEAVRCYNAHAYLACCSMAGAAAETIIIKTAEKLTVDRSKNESITKTREKIISVSDKGIKESLIAYSDIVKYWRDESMHHDNWETSGEKAYISLAMLLRLSMFVREKWFT